MYTNPDSKHLFDCLSSGLQPSGSQGEDGEIEEDVSGAVYHPALEFPSEHASTPATEINRIAATTSYTLASEWVPSNFDTSSSSTPPLVPGPSTTHTLRLLILRTSPRVISSRSSIALLDGYPLVELGRDAPLPGSPTPRIRLKEMEVSKLHASLF